MPFWFSESLSTANMKLNRDIKAHPFGPAATFTRIKFDSFRAHQVDDTFYFCPYAKAYVPNRFHIANTTVFFYDEGYYNHSVNLLLWWDFRGCDVSVNEFQHLLIGTGLLIGVAREVFAAREKWKLID